MVMIQVEEGKAEVFDVDFDQALSALRFLRDRIPPKPRTPSSRKTKPVRKSVRRSGR